MAWFLLRRGLRLGQREPASPRRIERRDSLCLIERPLESNPITSDYSFSFLNRQRAFDDGRIDWQLQDEPRLWRYNLHYFNYLLQAERSYAARDHLIDDWINQNPVGAENAWEPYTASLRIVNWVDYFLGTESQRPLKTEWLKSLYTQALWLERNLERHILANHYLKNSVALFFAGCFFEGQEAQRWLSVSRRLLQQEAHEQFLGDGGHYERSPMYHQINYELAEAEAAQERVPLITVTANGCAVPLRATGT